MIYTTSAKTTRPIPVVEKKNIIRETKILSFLFCHLISQLLQHNEQIFVWNSSKQKINQPSLLRNPLTNFYSIKAQNQDPVSIKNEINPITGNKSMCVSTFCKQQIPTKKNPLKSIQLTFNLLFLSLFI